MNNPHRQFRTLPIPTMEDPTVGVGSIPEPKAYEIHFEEEAGYFKYRVKITARGDESTLELTSSRKEMDE